ncbi:hypothetical protein H6F32_11665 [Anabaena sp. FACHB-1237]|uniref:hypothetical protein n=1 Tax=Anabaena sp. FACHB-1237 TaxID=2692769 RepID=UPI00167FE8A5|nr:hypothetical protein [Anabaena sp. FACHB-1237]MBD2138232.1 hypothetical protein [Anabaena sp. FACHB-1237]
MKALLPFGQVLMLPWAGLVVTSLLLPQPSIANPSQNLLTEGEGSINSLSNTASEINMFNLIHQAKFGIIQVNPEEQAQQLNDEVSKFRAKQNQLTGNGGQKPVIQVPGAEIQPSPKILPLNKDK